MRITKKIKNNFSGKLKPYSLMATTFLLSGTAVQAQVIYTDVDPDETYSTDGDFYLLDLNNDGDADFKLGVRSFLNPSMFHIGAIYYTGLVKYIKAYPYNGEIAGSHPGSYDYPYVLDSGNSIDASLVFQNNPAETFMYHLSVKDFPVVGYYYSYAGGNRGNWTGNTDKFIGLKLIIGADSYYGWARLDVSDNHHEFTIKDYAYNSTPDSSIMAGEMPVIDIIEQPDWLNISDINVYPNPSSNILELNITGIEINKISLEIFDAAGNKINNVNYSTDEIIKINISDLDTGIYLINISDKINNSKNSVIKFVKQ